MITTYEIETLVKCPADGAEIPYQITIINRVIEYVPEKILMVETLTEIVQACVREPILQEDLTARLSVVLANIYSDELVVRTVATHSGVKLTCEV